MSDMAVTTSGAPVPSRGALIGARLKAARLDRELTLAALAAATGISASTISRLESGKRQPNLELLIPLSATLEVTIDELVSDAAVPDPRVRPRLSKRWGAEVEMLSREGSAMQTVRMVLHRRDEEPELRSHEGFEWLYVLDGRLRLRLGEHDIVLKPGEAAEFATRVPHWLGSADDRPVEIIGIFSRDGERIHVRAQTEPDRRAGR
ncbi:helix-turn-helix domain-containing protein [Herbiconiux ginsengi]|uniref:Transcriptional regulator, XRE family with cupin sensor n=1 Tax=Herbiconiux ginsengi TaxID=381665 RepID=A0A1H3KX14_9MICO|nr:XRE family transcriptional regulator [Herbiconiux ginsengi]SDY56691.1 transcriptional regulator, XRE family with cupin sensor [Herbiconiux ginsengi]